MLEKDDADWIVSLIDCKRKINDAVKENILESNVASDINSEIDSTLIGIRDCCNSRKEKEKLQKFGHMVFS